MKNQAAMVAMDVPMLAINLQWRADTCGVIFNHGQCFGVLGANNGGHAVF